MLYVDHLSPVLLVPFVFATVILRTQDAVSSFSPLGQDEELYDSNVIAHGVNNVLLLTSVMPHLRVMVLFLLVRK